MFSPVYNHDGRISFFRVFCLVVLGLCIIAEILWFAQPEHKIFGFIQESVAKEQAAPGDIPEGAFEPEVDLALEHRLHNRSLAFTELEEMVDFMAYCGTINHGYIGCRYESSENLAHAYSHTFDAYDDGFAIMVKAINEQELDLCHTIIIDSTLTIEVYDRYGVGVTDKCVPGNFLHNSIAYPPRVADNTQSVNAPSGANVTERDLARESQDLNQQLKEAPL